MTIRLSPVLQTRIYAQLQQVYPNEGGGFLLGSVEGGGMVVVETRPVENVFAAEQQHHRYAMTSHDWARLEDEADARGLALLGYYHSHPDSPPIPSAYDREHALPNFVYVIVGVQNGQAVETRAWQLGQDRSTFDELTLLIE